MIKKSNAPLGASLVIVSSFFYASYGIWTKLMGDYFEGYTASALRSLLVLVMLVPLALAYNKLEPLKVKENWRSLTGMLVGSMFVWGPLYYAILHAGIGISIASNYAWYVIGLFFLGWLLGRERFTGDKWASATLGILGIGLVFGSSVTNFGFLALFAASISGIGAAIVSYSGKRAAYNTTQTTVVLWTTSAIANIFMAFVIGESYPPLEWDVRLVYLLIFAVASIAATWTLMRGMKLIEAGAAGVIGLSEIVFGIIFGIIFFHERPGPIELLGALLIITASAIPYIRDYNAKRGSLN